jgi:hypothetical protein
VVVQELVQLLVFHTLFRTPELYRLDTPAAQRASGVSICTLVLGKHGKSSIDLTRLARLREDIVSFTSSALDDTVTSISTCKASKLRQYLYFCTSKLAKRRRGRIGTLLLPARESCSICVSFEFRYGTCLSLFASDVTTSWSAESERLMCFDSCAQVCQYLYFCASKASKPSPLRSAERERLMCFDSSAPVRQSAPCVTRFTCFTGTKVQILTHLRASSDSERLALTLAAREIHQVQLPVREFAARLGILCVSAFVLLYKKSKKIEYPQALEEECCGSICTFVLAKLVYLYFCTSKARLPLAWSSFVA